MLKVATNPYLDPIKKVLSDLKATKWKFPFILPLMHAIISGLLLLVLLILYSTIGFVSQVSNSFWDVLAGQGQKMSFTNPLTSLYYAISATIFFVIFLPFFIVQSPFWISGWLTSKMGFKPFIILLFSVIFIFGIYHFQPKFAANTLDQIIQYHDVVKNKIFPPDTLNIQVEKAELINFDQ